MFFNTHKKINLTDNSFVLLGNASYCNRGCEAIIRGTTTILDSYFPSANYVVETIYYDSKEINFAPQVELNGRVVHVPFDFTHQTPFDKYLVKDGQSKKKFSNYQIFVKYLHREILGYLKKCKAALAIGGDNYSLDYSVPIHHVDLSNLVKKQNKPLILWGASVGPFTRFPEFEMFMRTHLKQFDIIFSREDLTSEYLIKLGVKPNNIISVSDPAFIMDPLQPANFFSDPQFKGLDGAIGLNLAGIIGKYWFGGNYKIWSEYCINLINRIIKKFERPLFLIPHVCHDLPYNNDYKFMQNILTHVDNTENIHLISPHYNSQELKYIISKLDCFIGSRLHSTIAAYSSAVPTLSISYSMKSQGICEEIYGDDQFCLTKDNHDIDHVVDLLAYSIDNNDIIRQQQMLKLIDIKKNAFKAGKVLRNLFN